MLSPYLKCKTNFQYQYFLGVYDNQETDSLINQALQKEIDQKSQYLKQITQQRGELLSLRHQDSDIFQRKFNQLKGKYGSVITKKINKGELDSKAAFLSYKRELENNSLVDIENYRNMLQEKLKRQQIHHKKIMLQEQVQQLMKKGGKLIPGQELYRMGLPPSLQQGSSLYEIASEDRYPDITSSFMGSTNPLKTISQFQKEQQLIQKKVLESQQQKHQHNQNKSSKIKEETRQQQQTQDMSKQAQQLKIQLQEVQNQRDFQLKKYLEWLILSIQIKNFRIIQHLITDIFSYLQYQNPLQVTQILLDQFDNYINMPLNQVSPLIEMSQTIIIMVFSQQNQKNKEEITEQDFKNNIKLDIKLQNIIENQQKIQKVENELDKQKIFEDNEDDDDEEEEKQCMEEEDDIIFSVQENVQNQNTEKIEIEMENKEQKDLDQEKNQKDDIQKQNLNELYIKILKNLFGKIEQQLIIAINNLIQKQKNSDQMVQLQEGYALNKITQIIKTILENPDIKLLFKKNKHSFIQQILNSVIYIKKLEMIFNFNYQQIFDNFQQFFEQMLSEDQKEQYEFLKETISILPRYSNDVVGENFLLEQCYKVLLPKNDYDNIMIHLSLHPGQTEYMPQPVQINDKSKSFGIYMKDVLEALKKHDQIKVQLQGLDLDLLVQNKIISNLDLKIETVYKNIWLPSQREYLEKVKNNPNLPLPTMKIIYKGRGIDGEAVEQQIDSLVDQDENKLLFLVKSIKEQLVLQDNNSQDEDSLQIKTTGIEILLKIMKRKYKQQAQKGQIGSICQILLYSCHYEDLRILILENDGLKIIIQVLMEYLSSFKIGESNQFIETVLQLINKLIDESGNSNIESRVKLRKKSEHVGEKTHQNINSLEKISIKDIELVIEKIEDLQNNLLISNKAEQSQEMIREFTRILPLLTNNLKAPSLFLIQKYGKDIKLNNNMLTNKENKQCIEQFLVMLEVVPEYFLQFKLICIDQNILQQAIDAFIQKIPSANDIDQENLKINKQILKYCLQIFYGLIKGAEKIQKILDDNDILLTILKLAEPSIKVEEIGKISESIIEYLTNEKSIVEKTIYDKLKTIKENEKMEKRKKALEKRKRQQQELKNKAKRVNDNLQKNYEIKKEQFVCIICQEGYVNQPSKLLGVYTHLTLVDCQNYYQWVSHLKLLSNEKGNESDFEQKVKLSLEQLDESISSGFTCVSSFNCIHFKCHSDAFSADNQGSKPKSEWEGAQIRNSPALCNNWLPLKGGMISEEQYIDGLNKFFTTLERDKIFQQLGILYTYASKNPISVAWNFLNSLEQLIDRFAGKSEIIQKSRTTFEQNIKFLPLMVQTISHFNKQPKSQDQLKENCEKLKQILNQEQKVGIDIKVLNLLIVSSIFCFTYQQWIGDKDLKNSVKFKCFDKILKINIQNMKKDDQQNKKIVFEQVQKQLIFLTFVDQIFQIINQKIQIENISSGFTQQNVKILEYLTANYGNIMEEQIKFYEIYKNKVSNFTEITNFLEYFQFQNIPDDEQYQYLKKLI